VSKRKEKVNFLFGTWNEKKSLHEKKARKNGAKECKKKIATVARRVFFLFRDEIIEKERNE
jgi:hypothetical protein